MTIREPRTLAATLLAALALAACGQPEEPLNIGMREVANDIVLGGDTTVTAEPTDVEDVRAPAPPPLPPTPVDVNAPVVAEPPAPPRFAPSPSPTTVVPPAVEVCPEDDPLEAPATESRRDSAAPPAEQELTYRNNGRFSLSGANANEGVFENDTVRTVTDVVTSDDSDDFTFAVAAPLGGTTTTTTYRVVNTKPAREAGTALDPAGVDDRRGLYLVSTVTEGPDGTTSTFHPVPELLLLPFPSVPGDTFTAAGTDPTTGVSMAYDGTVGETTRVNACGTPVQGIEVVLDGGRIVGPDQNLEFNARYVFATQFGGLSLEDEFIIAGTEAGESSSRENLATISEVPQAGPEPAEEPA